MGNEEPSSNGDCRSSPVADEPRLDSSTTLLSRAAIDSSPAAQDPLRLPTYEPVNLIDGKRVAPGTDEGATYPEVDFRALVPEIPNTQYATHGLHKHPAIFIPHIPRHLIETYTGNLNVDGERPLILDPFSGSGTTGVEALLLGRDYLGVEINPLSWLVSQVATSPIPPSILRRTKKRLERTLTALEGGYYPEYDVEFPTGTEKEHWFTESAIQSLTQIRKAISELAIEESDLHPETSPEAAAVDHWGLDPNSLRTRLDRFAVLTLASTVFDVSNADPSISKAHKSSRMRTKIEDGIHPPDPISVYRDHLERGYRKLVDLWCRIYKIRLPDAEGQLEDLSFFTSTASLDNNQAHNANIDIRLDDARTFSYPEYEGQVDLAITSPPYINAVNYYRGTKLRLFWLQGLLDGELKFETLRQSIVGSMSGAKLNDADEELPYTLSDVWTGQQALYEETSLPTLDTTIKNIHHSDLRDGRSRAYTAWTFFAKDMLQALTRTYEHLKPGACFFVVIGENTIAGEQIPSHRYIAEIARYLGRFEGHGGNLASDDHYQVRGFGWDEITNRDLFQSRNHAGGVIEGEWIVVLQKPVHR